MHTPSHIIIIIKQHKLGTLEYITLCGGEGETHHGTCIKKQGTTMSRLNALKIHLVLPGTKTQIGGWETNRKGGKQVWLFCDHMRTGFSCGTGGVCDVLASLGTF